MGLVPAADCETCRSINNRCKVDRMVTAMNIECSTTPLAASGSHVSLSALERTRIGRVDLPCVIYDKNPNY